MHPVRLAPSILSADFAALESSVASVSAQADLLHVDVMDGHFVPNLTIGPPVISSLRPHSSLVFDCHLMMTNPGEYLEAFKSAGADSVSVHIEIGSTSQLIAQARELGLGVGLAAKPDTGFDVYESFLADVDMVLLMTVFPGFGGQSFIESVLPKIEQTKLAIDERRLATRIEVDGGIDEITGPRCRGAGADTFVAGNAIFAQSDPLSAATRLKTALVSVGDG